MVPFAKAYDQIDELRFSPEMLTDFLRGNAARVSAWGAVGRRRRLSLSDVLSQ